MGFGGDLPAADRDFTWRDGERTIVFGEGAFASASELLAGGIWERFELVTTPRALGAAPLELAERAAAVHEVARGQVPDAAGAILVSVRNPTLVALGGGRVIDSAKAVAAVRGGRVCAMPTTLSGAEMTTIHRLPAGHEHEAPHLVRPALVIADPPQMTSLPEDGLRASAMNALAHGAESLYGRDANPVSTLVAIRGAELISTALDQDREERDSAALALGSLLCAHAVGSTGYALHHVVCQTLVRVLDVPHAETNATMLPHTMQAMRDRAPEAIAVLAKALGARPSSIGARIAELGGGPRHLAGIGADRRRIEVAVDRILARPELAATPDPPDREELRGLLQAAW